MCLCQFSFHFLLSTFVNFCQPSSHTFSISSSIVTEILEKNCEFSQICFLCIVPKCLVESVTIQSCSVYSPLFSKASSHPNHVGFFPRKYVLPIGNMLGGTSLYQVELVGMRVVVDCCLCWYH